MFWYAKHMATMNLQGKKAVVMGLGRFGGGVGVAAWLAEQGAEVLVTDMQVEDELTESLAKLKAHPMTFYLGGHDEAHFVNADLVVVSPAVRRAGNRYLNVARDAGALITSEIELLLERLPNPDHIVGITGTSGKSTTTAMLGRALGAAQTTWVGGNIGGSLLAKLPKIKAEDYVVLELSSFMLQGISERTEPLRIGAGVITNFSDNHLDWHADLGEYRDAKSVLLAMLCGRGHAVFGPGVAAAGFAAADSVPVTHVATEDGDDLQMRLAGRFNQTNAAVVRAVCKVFDQWDERAQAAVEQFEGLPHRMQFVGAWQLGGLSVLAHNDSKCTTTTGAIAAIKSFADSQQTVHVILGGYDKGDDYVALGREAARLAKRVYTLGDVQERIAEGVVQAGGQVVVCDYLDQAVREIYAHLGRDEAGQPQTILLSPGCASWDQFANYEQRGEQFAKLVAEAFEGVGAS